MNISLKELKEAISGNKDSWLGETLFFLAANQLGRDAKTCKIDTDALENIAQEYENYFSDMGIKRIGIILDDINDYERGKYYEIAGRLIGKIEEETRIFDLGTRKDAAIKILELLKDEVDNMK